MKILGRGSSVRTGTRRTRTSSPSVVVLCHEQVAQAAEEGQRLDVANTVSVHSLLVHTRIYTHDKMRKHKM